MGYSRYTLFTLAESVRLEKFLHLLDNMNIPHASEDFDVLTWTEIWKRFEKVNTVVLLTMEVNMTIYLLMLAPLFYTSNQENMSGYDFDILTWRCFFPLQLYKEDL